MEVDLNAVLFGLKRAHQSSVAVMRTMLAPFGLTPARFDMLYAINTWCLPAVRQSVVKRLLGVSAPTVSRMMRALEERGLVVREREEEDPRQRRVSLTDAGKALLQRAIDAVMETGAVDLLVGSALTERWWNDEGFDEAEQNVRRALGKMREAFRDRATLGYPPNRREPHPKYFGSDWFYPSAWGCDKGRFRKPRPCPVEFDEDDCYDERRDVDGRRRRRELHRDYGVVNDARAAWG